MARTKTAYLDQQVVYRHPLPIFFGAIALPSMADRQGKSEGPKAAPTTPANVLEYYGGNERISIKKSNRKGGKVLEERAIETAYSALGITLQAGVFDKPEGGAPAMQYPSLEFSLPFSIEDGSDQSEVSNDDVVLKNIFFDDRAVTARAAFDMFRRLSAWMNGGAEPEICDVSSAGSGTMRFALPASPAVVLEFNRGTRYSDSLRHPSIKLVFKDGGEGELPAFAAALFGMIKQLEGEGVFPQGYLVRAAAFLTNRIPKEITYPEGEQGLAFAIEAGISSEQRRQSVENTLGATIDTLLAQNNTGEIRAFFDVAVTLEEIQADRTAARDKIIDALAGRKLPPKTFAAGTPLRSIAYSVYDLLPVIPPQMLREVAAGIFGSGDAALLSRNLGAEVTEEMLAHSKESVLDALLAAAQAGLPAIQQGFAESVLQSARTR